MVNEHNPKLLGKSEGDFRLLVDSVKDYAIFMLCPEGTIRTWNKGAERMQGYPSQEVIGQHFSRFYFLEESVRPRPQESDFPLKEAEEKLRIATLTGRYAEEAWLVRKDKTRFWASIVITRLEDADGNLLGFSAVARDLSERQATEQALQESEERYQQLVDGVKDYAIFLIDRRGLVSTWNEGAKRLKGYSSEEIIGQHFSRFYTREDIRIGKCEYELRESTETGRYQDDGWCLRKDGTKFWANVVMTSLRDKKGEVYGFSRVIRDMTDRRRVEEKIRMAYEDLGRRIQDRTQALSNSNAALRERERQLQQAVRARDEFFSVASHELKTPITTLKLQLQMLSKKVLEENSARVSMQMIQKSLEISMRQTTRLNSLVEDLLDATRVQSGTFHLHFEQVDLVQLVRSSVDRMGANLGEVGCDVVLWAPSPVLANADPLRMNQVISNLLSNTIKYAPFAPVNISVTEENGIAKISVQDSGTGIPQEIQDRIFEKFEQAAPATSRANGIGLGLFLVQSIIKGHHGRVQIQSHPGKGATFIIELPTNIARFVPAHEKGNSK